MQVQKLEEELGVRIFDRSRFPVVPTDTGRAVIDQAKKILSERNQIGELISSKKDIAQGELRIGIIPTLAPYLLPLFVQAFTKKYPRIKLIVHEMTTDTLLAKIRESTIDVGILVTPLQQKGMSEEVLFYEELVAYVSEKNGAYKKQYVLAKDIDPNKLWMLEEGHCFRSQVINLCELYQATRQESHFDYEAGSFETLRRMVDVNDGITILPELATLDFTARQKKLIRHFRKLAPTREVSLVVHRDFVKERLIKILRQEILAAIPDKIRNNKDGHVVPLSDA